MQPGVSPTRGPAVSRQPGAVAVDVVAGGVVRGCTQGARCARVDTGYAHHTGWNECIYGVFLRPGGAGARPKLYNNSARASARIVPEAVPEPVP